MTRDGAGSGTPWNLTRLTHGFSGNLSACARRCDFKWLAFGADFISLTEQTHYVLVQVVCSKEGIVLIIMTAHRESGPKEGQYAWKKIPTAEVGFNIG